MIDKEDYQSFVWVRDNVGGNYDRAILDPWKAAAFTAITEKYVYTWIHGAKENKDEEAYKFLRGGSTDTEFLRENSISIVYTEWNVNNPNLTEVRENVYLLKEAGTQ